MANLMKIFKSEQFGAVRTMVDDETKEVVFCALDVAAALGHKNPQRAIRDYCKGVTEIVTPSTGGPQKMKYIKEADIYRLVMRSTLPDAEKFQDWVCEVVLPQIRKTGGYIPVNEQDDEKTILSKAVMILQKTLAKKEELIEAQRPQVAFANALCGSNSSIRMSEMAKLLTQNGHEIGRTRLFGWMRRNGYIFKNSTEPKQEWVSRGYFEVKATLVETHHGAKESITPLITAEGQRYFLQMFCNS